MMKQTVEYEDLEGKTRHETVYLNLTEAELAELQFEYEGGFEAHVQHLMDTGDNKNLFAMFKMLLVKAYGRRTEDGRLVKKQEWREEFESSQAYSEVFMALATDPNKAASFFNEIMPKKLQERVAAMKQTVDLAAVLPQTTPNFVQPTTPAPVSPLGVRTEELGPNPVWVREGRFPTKTELENATPEEMGAWQRSLGK